MGLLLLIANMELIAILLAAAVAVVALAILGAALAVSKWPAWAAVSTWIASCLAIAAGFPFLASLLEWPAAWLAVQGYWLIG